MAGPPIFDNPEKPESQEQVKLPSKFSHIWFVSLRQELSLRHSLISVHSVELAWPSGPEKPEAQRQIKEPGKSKQIWFVPHGSIWGLRENL